MRRLIKAGHSKSAVEIAKGIHKRFNNGASETLLVDAYLARVRSMQEHGMATESSALLSMIRDRYPAGRAKLEAFANTLTIETGSIEDLGRLLSEAGDAREQRKAIETALRGRLSDPAALANCASLPPEHPLRAGAAAVCEAFAAVTSGPVTDAQIALPEIAHRDPLAPWKALVRAIACFHSADDEGCERNLQAVDPKSPPARLAPALRAMIAGQPPARLKPAALALMGKVGGDMEALRNWLREAEAAFERDNDRKILEASRSAVQTCRKAAPDLVERLKQHLSFRMEDSDIEPGREDAALGGPCLKNAYYWLLSARDAEHPRKDLALTACGLWEQFRRHAVNEGWFPANGQEVATLYLRMVSLLERIPPAELEFEREDFFDEFSSYEYYYDDQPDSVRAASRPDEPEDYYYLFPENLYARASECDPDPRTFSLWFDWTRRAQGRRAADPVAEAWQRAAPGDPRPLLYLVESAEERGALKKALDYLTRAEALDAVNPEVRRARFRLLVGRVRMHLLQRKPHLAEKNLSTLSALPQAREGDRPAFLAALRWVSSRMAGNLENASAQLAEARRLLKSEGTGCFLIGTVAETLGMSPTEIDIPKRFPLAPDECLSKFVAQVCTIGEDVGMEFAIPGKLEELIIEDLAEVGGKLSLMEIRTLAETALRRNLPALAYAASAAGLERPGASEARFLLLRARALPGWDSRRRDCLETAAELAQRQGDTALAGEALELKRKETSGMGFLDILDSLTDAGGVSVSAERLAAVLKRERAARTYSPPHSSAPGYDDLYSEFSDEDFGAEAFANEIFDGGDEMDEDFVPIFGEPRRRVQMPHRPANPRQKQRDAKQTEPPPGPEQGSLF